MATIAGNYGVAWRGGSQLAKAAGNGGKLAFNGVAA
jgi:hypothetical protein